MNESQIYQGLCGFIKKYSTLDTVLRGLQNRVQLPRKGAVISFIKKEAGSTPSYSVADGNEYVTTPMVAEYQLDVFGEGSYEIISRLRSLYTSPGAIRYFRNYEFEPMYATRIANMTGYTFINEQYVERYQTVLPLSYSETWSVTTDIITDYQITLRVC